MKTGNARFLHLFVVLIAALAVSGHAQQDTTPKVIDPEQSEAGRESYLGRRIAQTMHWTGAEWLLRESRQDEENCSRMLRELRIEAGQTVCDFGCGNGFYTLPLAERVGSEGRVIAVDIQQEMLTLLEGRVKKAGHKNVETLLATLTDPKLPADSCDMILLVDVYHEISHPVSVLAGLRKALKKDGRLILIEFRREDPDVPIKLQHKMSKAQMILEMHANGLRFAHEFDSLPWQHLMAFEKDPEFPRESGQDQAMGCAVAEGFVRAYRAADLRSLSGFYAETVSLRGESALLSEARGEKALLEIPRDEMLGRIKQHLDKISAGRWYSAMSELEFRCGVDDGLWVGKKPTPLFLSSTDQDANLNWYVERNDHGQWHVTSEGGHF